MPCGDCVQLVVVFVDSWVDGRPSIDAWFTDPRGWGGVVLGLQEAVRDGDAKRLRWLEQHPEASAEELVNWQQPHRQGEGA